MLSQRAWRMRISRSATFSRLRTLKQHIPKSFPDFEFEEHETQASLRLQQEKSAIQEHLLPFTPSSSQTIVRRTGQDIHQRESGTEQNADGKGGGKK